MPRKLSTALASLALLLLLAAGAQADPLVITGGTAIIRKPFSTGNFDFNLLAPGIVASGFSGNATLTTIFGDDVHFPGSVTVNGVTQTGEFFPATELRFSLAPYTQPPGCCPPFDLYPGVNTIIIDTAFTMEGRLTFGPDWCPNCEFVSIPTFNREVIGSGFAQLIYTRTPGGNSFFPTGATYAFGATEPIPEPATLLLLGTGLAGIAAKVRRRRKVADEA